MLATMLWLLKQAVVTLSHLGCEVKSEPVWSHQGPSLVCLTKDLSEGKVEGVGACVVIHDQLTAILQYSGWGEGMVECVVPG